MKKTILAVVMGVSLQASAQVAMLDINDIDGGTLVCVTNYGPYIASSVAALNTNIAAHATTQTVALVTQRVWRLEARSNEWNTVTSIGLLGERTAAAAAFAYSPTNPPPIQAHGTDLVARAMAAFAYSPTNRPAIGTDLVARAMAAFAYSPTNPPPTASTGTDLVARAAAAYAYSPTNPAPAFVMPPIKGISDSQGNTYALTLENGTGTVWQLTWYTNYVFTPSVDMAPTYGTHTNAIPWYSSPTEPRFLCVNSSSLRYEYRNGEDYAVWRTSEEWSGELPVSLPYVEGNIPASGSITLTAGPLGAVSNKLSTFITHVDPVDTNVIKSALNYTAFGLVGTPITNVAEFACLSNSPVVGNFSHWAATTTGVAFAKFRYAGATDRYAIGGVCAVTCSVLHTSAPFTYHAELALYAGGTRTLLASGVTLNSRSGTHAVTNTSFSVPYTLLAGRDLSVELVATSCPTQQYSLTAISDNPQYCFGVGLVFPNLNYTTDQQVRQIVATEGVNVSAIDARVALGAVTSVSGGGTNYLGQFTNLLYVAPGGATGSIAFPVTGMFRTGMTNAWMYGDDGWWQAGKAKPTPRYSVVGTGAGTNRVRDNAYNIEWARNFDLAGWTTNFDAAVIVVSNLNVAAYGGVTGWRIPNICELMSLINFRYEGPCVANAAGTGQHAAGDPFNNLKNEFYWSCTERIGATNTILTVYFNYAYFQPLSRDNKYRVSACRTP